jgi:hypothetical protein
LAYLLTAVVFTWPLVLRINSSVYGVRGDHFVQLWETWWRKNALLKGESLTFTDLIYAPSGFDFSKVPVQPLPTIFNLILALPTNEVLALNILLLLSFPLSGLAVYFLVKHLVRDKLAASFSGLVYAFSMYHFSHAWEHSTLISIYWMPFYILTLVNFDQKKTARNAFFAALLLTVVLWDNFYYGFITATFTAFFFLFRLRSWLNVPFIKRAFLFAFLVALFASPVLLPMLRSSSVGGASTSRNSSFERSEHDLNWFSARPWFYVLPSTEHPLLGRYSKRALAWIAQQPPYFLTQPYSGKEHNLYLTMTALILAALAVLVAFRRRKESNSVSVCQRRQRRQWYQWVWPFLFLGMTMAIFSAPPYATISLHKIYFPSHFLHKFIPMFRAYARFGVLVLLCVSVLAGFGLHLLLDRLSPQKQYLLTVLFSLIVLFEVWLPSFNVDLTPPEAYRWLAKQPGDFIVLEFPPRTDHSALLYQRVHGKRLFNPVRENPQDILHAPNDQVSKQALLYREIRERPELFYDLGVRYVIFHENDPFLPFDLGYFREPQFRVAYRSHGIAVYEITAVK